MLNLIATLALAFWLMLIFGGGAPQVDGASRIIVHELKGMTLGDRR